MKKAFKKTIALTLALIMALGAAPLSSFADLDLFGTTASAANIIYLSFRDKSLTETELVYCNPKASGMVEIPSHYLGKAVTGICKFAFDECNLITAIKIPKTLIRVEEHAFDGCTSLERFEIEFGYNVLSVRDGVLFYGSELLKYPAAKKEAGYAITDCYSVAPYAFFDCKYLKALIISESLSQINKYAFCGCESLVSVFIPSSIKIIGDGAFAYCKSLTDVIIPESVDIIKGYTFFRCEALKSVVIPNTITEIGMDAFSGCRSLENIVIPNSVEEISSGAFSECESLKSVSLPNGENKLFIGINAFYGCEALESIDIPGNATIYCGAFSSCIALKTVNISNGVISICDGAFSYCSSLVSIDIPSSVKYVDEAFAGCTSLEYINVAPENSMLFSRDGVLFSNNGKTLECYPAAKSDTSYSIPDGVIYIDKYAFDSCKSLEIVTIPNTVENIGKGAFGGCTSIKSINIPASVTYMGSGPFIDCTSLESFTVDASNEYYSAIDGVLFNKNKTTLLAYPLAKGETNYTLPSGKIYIENYAFYNCTSLTSITIPKGTKDVGFGLYSLSGCTSLKDIYVEDSRSLYNDLKGIELLSEINIHFCGNENIFDRVLRFWKSILDFFSKLFGLDR